MVVNRNPFLTTDKNILEEQAQKATERPCPAAGVRFQVLIMGESVPGYRLSVTVSQLLEHECQPGAQRVYRFDVQVFFCGFVEK